jgi:hypothetical protein
MMRRPSVPWLPSLGLLLAALAFAPAARAAESAAVASDGAKSPVALLVAIVLGLLGCVGAGAVALVLRVILPGVAGAADASLARLRPGRLVLAGVVPILGAALLGRGVALVGQPALGAVYLLAVVLPLAIALLLGAMAALPHLGARVLRADPPPSPLRCASVGGLVTGLSMASWVLPPLGVAFSVLLAGWLLGIGLGAFVRRPVVLPPPVEPGAAP